VHEWPPVGRRIFRPTEANVSCSNLSVAAAYEHADSASSPARLQSIGVGGKSGEPGRSSPDIPGPVVPEDLGAGAASLGAAQLGTSTMAPHLTKSYSKPPTPSPTLGLAPSTSTLAAPCDASSAPSSTRIVASHASDAGSSKISGSTGAITDRGRPGATTTRSPTPIAGDATKGGRGDVTRSVAPVTPTSPSKVRPDIGEVGAASTNEQRHAQKGRTPVRKTKGGPCWTRASYSWCPMRTAPPTWSR
jgi:hypothetical protein